MATRVSTKNLQRHLHYSDNLPVLKSMEDESVDLIYLDPPFNSNATYNIIYPDDLGQVRAFDDTWNWNTQCDKYLEELQAAGKANILAALIEALGKVQICAYLVNMAVRLVEMKRILKSTGSIYLHCDPTASHYLKIVLDDIFGNENFLNEVIWCYRKWTNAATHFQKNHDIILVYTKKYKEHFFKKLYVDDSPQQIKMERGWDVNVVQDKIKQLIVYDKKKAKNKIDSKNYDRIVYRTEKQEVALHDWWEIPIINSQARERLGYPTQKPLALIERIIKASSREGDIVLDPFCGCGTTIEAAENLKRHWIGIDITYSSIAAIQERFRRQGVDIWSKIKMHKLPRTVDEIDKRLIAPQGSSQFARKEFEKFCVTSIGGLPNDKMGADGGIDGRILLYRDKRAICSVKSGHVDVRQIRELNGLLDGKKDIAGVFITRHDPTRDMVQFAQRAGIEKIEEEGELSGLSAFPKIQILTLADILKGHQPDLPYKKYKHTA